MRPCHSIIKIGRMSSNVCSMSGQPLLHPVVSTKTGHIYEKEAIHKHLSTFPYCPITNQDMSTDDLIEVAPSLVPLTKSNESARTFMTKLQ